MVKFVRIGCGTPELAMVGTRIYGFYGVYPWHKSPKKKNVFPIEHGDIGGFSSQSFVTIFRGVFSVRKRCSTRRRRNLHPKRTKHRSQRTTAWDFCEGRKLQGSFLKWDPFLGRIKLDTNFYGFCCWGWRAPFFVFCLGWNLWPPEVAGGNWFENWTLWDSGTMSKIGWMATLHAIQNLEWPLLLLHFLLQDSPSSPKDRA